VKALFDTHAHLDQVPELRRVLDDAREAGVVGIIAVGVDVRSNENVLRIAQEWPGFVYPALGLHPCELVEHGDARITRELDFIRGNLNAACALGEVGLDYHKRTIADVPRELQQEVLRALLATAAARGLPALIHSRYAWTDALRLVVESHVERAVFHWFTGFASVLKGIMDAGYYVSATPAAEYHEEHRRAVRAAPRGRLVLETDTPVWYGRTERFQATPADVVRSLKAVAELRGETEDDVAAHTTFAARQLIGVSAPPDSKEDA
jgi:TatD DNase family protein